MKPKTLKDIEDHYEVGIPAKALCEALDGLINKATVERRFDPLSGETIDLVNKAELRTQIKSFFNQRESE